MTDKTDMGGPDYMRFNQPTLRVVETMGGFFRVVVHGLDNLQQDSGLYAEMDIGRGATKDEALSQAEEWFCGMKDRTPRTKRTEGQS